MNLSDLQSKIYLSPHHNDLGQSFPFIQESKSVVFTNGCFDILHEGHISSLLHASSLGDILIVGLNSDESVRNLKGITRPVVPQTSRSTVLASMSFVDFVVIFDESTPRELLNYLQPDVIVKGQDYIVSDVVKHSDEAVVSLAPLVPDLSTSSLSDKYYSLKNS